LVCSNDTGLLLERRPDTVRGPDVFFYDEIGRYSDLEIRWPDKPPTLIVEVLSPNDRWGKVTRRLTEYLNRGTPLVWLVDPEDQTVTVYHSGQQIPQVFEGTDELTGNDVLPDFRCRVADFFYLPGEETPSAGS
jgi:Uma2 family endonuclease